MLSIIATTSSSPGMVSASSTGAFTLSKILRCFAVALIRLSASGASAPRAQPFKSLHVAMNALCRPRVTSIRLSSPRCIGLDSACFHCCQHPTTNSAGKPDAVTCTLLLQEIARCRRSPDDVVVVKKDIIDGPSKCADLHLEPCSDTLDIGKRLTGEHLEQKPGGNMILEIESGSRPSIGLCSFLRFYSSSASKVSSSGCTTVLEMLIIIKSRFSELRITIVQDQITYRRTLVLADS